MSEQNLKAARSFYEEAFNNGNLDVIDEAPTAAQKFCIFEPPDGAADQASEWSARHRHCRLRLHTHGEIKCSAANACQRSFANG